MQFGYFQGLPKASELFTSWVLRESLSSLNESPRRMDFHLRKLWYNILSICLSWVGSHFIIKFGLTPSTSLLFLLHLLLLILFFTSISKTDRIKFKKMKLLTLKRKETRAGIVAQEIKLLPCKHEKMNLILKTHILKKGWGRQRILVCEHITRQAETGGSL